MSDVEAHRSPTAEPARRRGLYWAVVPALLLAGLAWAYVQSQRDGGATADQSLANASSITGQETTFMPKINKSDEEWANELTPEQFEVTRRQGTERPFSGELWNHKEKGMYKCVCCGAPLFTSETKYDSGCGWPSFYASSNPENLHTLTDTKYGMVRIEVRCENCGAHLGHVFDDGPQPTGQRYCMNSAALKFEKKEGQEKKE